jgi:hypothetical protein
MGKTLAFNTRFAGRHFQSKPRFGRQWRMHFVPADLLEFSEYGRDHAYPHGSWLLLSVGLGALIWLAVIAAMI